MLDEDEDARLEELLSGCGEEPGQSEKGRTSGRKHTSGGRRDERDEHDDCDDEHNEHEDIVELGDDAIEILQGCGDGLAFTTNFDTDSLEFFHGNVAVHVLVEHGECGSGFVVAVESVVEILGMNSLCLRSRKSSVESAG